MSLSRLLSILAPPLCVSCGAAASLHQPLCRACLGDLRWLSFEQAPGAGVPVWAAVSYEGPARALVRALKFRGAIGLVDELVAPDHVYDAALRWAGRFADSPPAALAAAKATFALG